MQIVAYIIVVSFFLLLLMCYRDARLKQLQSLRYDGEDCGLISNTLRKQHFPTLQIARELRV